jgi:hypothetical protein
MSNLLRASALIGVLALIAGGCAVAPLSSPSGRAPASGVVGPVAATPAAAERVITLIRSRTCGCCAGHEAHLARAGYAVSSQLTDAYVSVKDAHAIPTEMRSCHTSLVGRYFVEGHVPVEAIDRLLAEAPDVDGIALPGMPSGSPGMGGVAAGPLTVYAIRDGEVVGEFGSFEAPAT